MKSSEDITQMTDQYNNKFPFLGEFIGAYER